jgi:hypothetical protein
MAGREAAGIWSLAFSPASIQTGSVEHQRASLMAFAITGQRFSALAIRTRPAHRAFRVAGRRVDQQPCHRPTLRLRDVESLRSEAEL